MVHGRRVYIRDPMAQDDPVYIGDTIVKGGRVYRGGPMLQGGRFYRGHPIVQVTHVTPWYKVAHVIEGPHGISYNTISVA